MNIYLLLITSQRERSEKKMTVLFAKSQESDKKISAGAAMCKIAVKSLFMLEEFESDKEKYLQYAPQVFEMCQKCYEKF